MRKEKEKSYNRIESIVTISVFAVIIAIFFAGSLIAGDKEFSDNENRYLAEMPKLVISDVTDGTYGKGIEVYVQDHIIARDILMGLKSSSDSIIGKKDNGEVYFGDNGYLFAIEEIDYNQLEKNISYVNVFADKIAESGRDIDIKTMIVPTASEIYPENLPKNANVPLQTEEIAKIANALNCDFVDVTDILKKHASEYIYYRTDHHWTTLGSYYAYKAYINKVMGRAESIDNPAEAGYSITTVSDDFLGTNYSKALLPSTQPESIIRIEKRSAEDEKSNTKLTVLNAKYEVISTFDEPYDESYLEKKDKYSYFISGNNPIAVLEKERAEKQRSNRNLLVVKDSYSHCMLPFLADDFDSVTAVDMRYFRSNLDRVIEEYGITDVLFLYNIYNFASDKNLIYIAK